MGELIDPKPLMDSTKEKVGAIFDLNQQITSSLREKAVQFEELANTYQHMARMTYEVVEAIGQLAVISSSNASDIIVAEFGLEVEEDEIDETAEGGEV